MIAKADPRSEENDVRDRWSGSVLWVHVKNDRTGFSPIGGSGPAWTDRCAGTAFRILTEQWQKRQAKGFARGELSLWMTRSVGTEGPYD